jgi:ABC-type uncharacterized transport system substrate-binding protein
MKTWKAVQRLWLGIFLIAGTSSVLLISDWSQRQGTSKLRRVAVIQHASQAALDEGVDGIVDGLAAHGFVDGKTIALARFNAANDLPTANAIASQVANGGYDLVVTSSTLSLQTTANANRAGRVKHVFGIVSDPFSAGVGINRANPLDHPKHLTGYGSMISVEKVIDLAREMYPQLKTIGLVWNPTESNSLAYTKGAREACRKLGMTLLEANAENSAGVREAASSVVSRGAQAIFLTGDVTVLVAADAVVAAAKQGKIPVFSLVPPNVNKGTLFDLGANFYEVGKQVGDLAANVLNGTDPATVPVVNSVPEKLAINKVALTGLRDPWKFTPEMLAHAQLIVDEQGVHDLSKPSSASLTPPAAGAAVPAGKMYKLGVVYFAPEEGADLDMKGLFDGLAEAGIKEGQNLTVKRAHAQSEIANIPALLQNYDNQDLDLIVTLTTPCLTAACSTVHRKPVVFTYVYDPVAAGAGASERDHLAHITGVGSFPPVNDTVDLIQKLVPGVKTVGTLYNSSEANSRKVISVGRTAFTARGIKLEEVTVTGTADILQAAQAITSRRIQALWVTGDNTALQGFDAIAKAAHDAKLPLFINDPEFTPRGALASVGLGWYESGHEAGKLAARVLKGEDPKNLPFENVVVKKLVLNHEVARQLGVTFPPEVLKQEAAK